MKKQNKRQAYMLKMSNQVKVLGGHTGKIDWNIALFHYHNQDSFVKAAYSVIQEQKRINIIQ